MRIVLFGHEILNISNEQNTSETSNNHIRVPKVDPRLEKFITKEEEEDNKRKIDRIKQEQKHRKYIENKNEYILPNIRIAHVNEYIKWLDGFLDSGETPTHRYSYPFSQWDSFYIAYKDFVITPLYGSASINIIVPKGIKVTGNPGHTNLYFFDGYCTNNGFIPIFSDTICINQNL